MLDGVINHVVSRRYHSHEEPLETPQCYKSFNTLTTQVTLGMSTGKINRFKAAPPNLEASESV